MHDYVNSATSADDTTAANDSRWTSLTDKTICTNNYFVVTFLTCKTQIIPGQFKSRKICVVPNKAGRNAGH